MKSDLTRQGVFEVVEQLLLKTFFNRSTPVMPISASEGCFWPITAFMRTEVKKNFDHVKTQRILNKLSEIKFFPGCMQGSSNSICMVWPYLRLSVSQDICQILMRLSSLNTIYGYFQLMSAEDTLKIS